MRYVMCYSFRRAGLSSHLEVGSGWVQESSRTRPADILGTNWDNGISAAFDVTIASPLNSSIPHVPGADAGFTVRGGGASGVSRISARGVLKVRPHTKSGGGASGPIYETWGGGGGGGGGGGAGGASDPIYEKWGGGGGGGVRFRSDIRKVGGGGGGGALQVRCTKSGGGGHYASGPIPLGTQKISTCTYLRVT